MILSATEQILKLFHCANLRQTRKINQGQTQNMGRVNLEVDGTPIDSLVTAGNPSSFGLNLSADLRKVIKPPSKLMKELSKLLLSRLAIRSSVITTRFTLF